jgi:diketogulonate reductase-like aldo/keto reductase
MPVMAYSPLGGLGADLLHDPALARIGAATIARQPLLRWPGLSASAISSQFPNPALTRM